MPKLSLVKCLYIKTFLHFNQDNPDQKRESTYMMMSLHTGSIMHIIFCFLSIEFIGILFKVLVSLKLKYTHLPDILVHTMLSFLVIEWVCVFCFIDVTNYP